MRTKDNLKEILGSRAIDKKRLMEGLQRTVPILGIDIDRMSKYTLLLTYFKAKKSFPDSRIEVRISSSGKGFHILIHDEMTILENILWRARLNDDDRRLIYSLRKFAHNPDMKFFDLMFNEKYGLKSREIDMDELLKPHMEDVVEIWNDWGSDESLRLVKELSSKVELSIVRYWTTGIKIKNTIKDKLVGVFEDISLQDESFRWRIFPNFLGYGYIALVYSPTKDIAQKRGLWMVKNVSILKNHKYWVRQI